MERALAGGAHGATRPVDGGRRAVARGGYSLRGHSVGDAFASTAASSPWRAADGLTRHLANRHCPSGGFSAVWPGAVDLAHASTLRGGAGARRRPRRAAPLFLRNVRALLVGTRPWSSGPKR